MLTRWILAGVALALAGCTGGSPQAVVTVTASPNAAESPSFATPGTATDEEWVGPTCDSLTENAMKVSRRNARGSGLPTIQGIIRIRGPVVDKTLDPPRNGDVFVCTGTAVWSSGSNSRIRYGVQRQGGQWFDFYEPA